MVVGRFAMCGLIGRWRQPAVEGHAKYSFCGISALTVTLTLGLQREIFQLPGAVGEAPTSLARSPDPLPRMRVRVKHACPATLWITEGVN